MGGPDPQRKERVKFQRRSQTLLAKSRELATLCGADVYLFINHPRDTFVYNSADDCSWPPPDEALEYHYPTLRREPSSVQSSRPDMDLHELKRLLKYFATRADLLRSLNKPSRTQQSSTSDITQ
ncbi:hypothetical protein NUU61_009368, partial [Penicillium alfredii]